MAKSQRGFAAMTPEQQRAIAAAGGRAAHRSRNAHEFTSEEARAAGKKGGAARHHGKGFQNSSATRVSASVSRNGEDVAHIDADQVGRRDNEFQHSASDNLGRGRGYDEEQAEQQFQVEEGMLETMGSETQPASRDEQASHERTARSQRPAARNRSERDMNDQDMAFSDEEGLADEALTRSTTNLDAGESTGR